MRRDSREGFGIDECEAYRAAEENVRQHEEQYCDEFSAWLDKIGGDEIELCDCGDCPACDALREDENDGQPDEYTEWQDYMGGDDNPYDNEYNDNCDY